MAYDLNLSHPCYLPNTEQRIERLKGVINKRPVAIILHGYSTTELEERITELKDCDICYASVNLFWMVEKYILSKINRNLSIVMCSASPNLELDYTIGFLERREDNLLISTQATFDHYRIVELIPKYDSKLLFHSTVSISSPNPTADAPLHFPLMPSLSVILPLTIIGEAPKVAIFGADGGRIRNDALYYRQSERAASSTDDNLRYDTRQFNECMLGVLERVYKTFGIAPVDIVNCSLQSCYTPFRKLSYADTFDFLRR